MDTPNAKPADPSIKLTYADRAECVETFADSVNASFFDGQTLRLEFGVTRIEEVKPGSTASGRRLPVCRLVLSPAGAVDLINRMQQIANGLRQAGILKATEQPGAPAKQD